MTRPLHQETTEVRLQYILDRKDKDLQHIALFGPKVADRAWEDAVERAIKSLQIIEGHAKIMTPDFELALYLTIQQDIIQVGHQFLAKYDLWVVMDEARRRMSGELPRGPPGKKKPRYPGENEVKRIWVQHPEGTVNAKNIEVKDYYTNPAIPRTER